MKTIIAVVVALVATGSGSPSPNERPVGHSTSARRATSGAADFTAIPWAEVWMDGKKLGETPMMHQPVPLGKREFVFKNPKLGERRVTVTIRADSVASVSVDMRPAK